MEFYPPAAPVPSKKLTERLILRPLRADDAELDYAALMSSREMLRRWSGSEWPPDDFTVEQNRADLERHEREHLERSAFTFTVLNPQADTCLGCVYLQPLSSTEREVGEGAEFPTVVGFWVRHSEISHDLDRHLFLTLREWLQADWDFDCVLFSTRPEESRQAALFQEAGLKLRRTVSTPESERLLIYR